MAQRQPNPLQVALAFSFAETTLVLTESFLPSCPSHPPSDLHEDVVEKFRSGTKNPLDILSKHMYTIVATARNIVPLLSFVVRRLLLPPLALFSHARICRPNSDRCSCDASFANARATFHRRVRRAVVFKVPLFTRHPHSSFHGFHPFPRRFPPFARPFSRRLKPFLPFPRSNRPDKIGSMFIHFICVHLRSLDCQFTSNPTSAPSASARPIDLKFKAQLAIPHLNCPPPTVPIHFGQNASRFVHHPCHPAHNLPTNTKTTCDKTPAFRPTDRFSKTWTKRQHSPKNSKFRSVLIHSIRVQLTPDS